jgi:hypothetical protein
MGLIADLCPNCQRITRCVVVERGSITGGVILGVPFVLPVSSVSCSCGECGFEFRSEFWDHARTVAPDEAARLDVEALLGYTNPALKEKVVLSELQANPRLRGAFDLLERLAPGGLRTALKVALLRWSGLDARRQEAFLASVGDCSRALDFAHSMAGRYRFGAVGCLAGILVCVGVWSGCLLVFGIDLTFPGWAAVIAAGVMIGGLVSALLWSNRAGRWVKGVLLPEARRSGIRSEALLAVLEGGGSSRQVGDGLELLREVAPALRAELAASGKPGDEPGFAFGTMP